MQRAALQSSRNSMLTWLLGFTTSLLGDQIFYVALTWAAVQVTTPGNVGLILVANTVARAVVLLLGGVLVDRVGPKRLIIGSDALRVLVMVAMAVVVAASTPAIEPLVVLAVVFGVVDGFFLPAVESAPAYVVRPSTMTRLQGIKTIIKRGALFGGAPLGSWLIITGDVSLAFWANAVLFTASVAALAVTSFSPRPLDAEGDADDETPSTAVTGWWADLADGLRTIWANPTLRTLIVVVGLLDLGFTGPMTIGVPLLADEKGWGVSGVGWLFGGFGVGAAVTALYLTVRSRVRRPGLVAMLGLMTMGAAAAAIGLVTPRLPATTTGVVMAAAVAVVAGFGAGVCGTLINAVLVTLAPRAHLGRVMAVVVLASDTVMPISLALTGWVTEWTGAVVPFIGGGLMMAAAAVFGLANRRVRSLEPVGSAETVAVA